MEAALRKMKNGKEAGKDKVNIEPLEAGDETIAKQLAKLNTKCITERRIPKTGKEANKYYGDIFQEMEWKRHHELQKICLLSNICKLFTNNNNN